MMPLWLELLFLFGFPTALFLTILLWIIDHVWLTPQESKAIKKAKRKKKPIVNVGFDNGISEFKVVKEIGDEGYIKTEDGWIGFLPRPIAASGSNPEGENLKASELMTKVFHLKDARVPILHGYSGKAVLPNVKSLAALEHTPFSKSKQKLKLPFKLGRVNIFWPVDLRTIKTVFPKSWNQAQVRASQVKSELIGMLKGKKFFGMEGLKYFVLPGMIIIAILVIFALIMVFLR